VIVDEWSAVADRAAVLDVAMRDGEEFSIARWS
jgi:hypothetical protein